MLRSSGAMVWVKIVCGVEHGAAVRPVSEPRKNAHNHLLLPNLVLLPNISDSFERCTTIHCIADIFVCVQKYACVFYFIQV